MRDVGEGWDAGEASSLLRFGVSVCEVSGEVGDGGDGGNVGGGLDVGEGGREARQSSPLRFDVLVGEISGGGGKVAGPCIVGMY